MVDILAVLIESSKRHDLVRVLVPHLVDGGLSILQYSDNTILFLEDCWGVTRKVRMTAQTQERVLSTCKFKVGAQRDCDSLCK
jgi:hypothetical protein